MRQEVFDILEQSNYLVTATAFRNTPLAGDTDNTPYAIIKFPEKVIIPSIPAHYYVYMIQHDKSRVVLEKWETPKDGSQNMIFCKEFKMPIYAMRTFIIAHLILMCQKYGYAKEYSLYLSDDTEQNETDVKLVELDTIDGFFKALFAPDTTNDLDLEDKFVAIFIKTFGKYFSSEYDTLATEYGVIDGYVMLRSLLKEIQE